MVSEGVLVAQTEIQLTSTNAPNRCPFDPNRINLEFEKPIEFILSVENPVSSAEPSSLGFKIVELRDNINAIFGEKFKGRILTIPQERSLVELFKGCKEHEDFAYRVASLSGLVTAIDSNSLKININRQEKIKENGLKPLNILGEFLRERYPDEDKKVNSIMDVLKNFNRLRMMYPIHKDRANGVLAAHQFFGLDYPVSNYNIAWRLLLIKYRDTLNELFSVLKNG